MKKVLVGIFALVVCAGMAVAESQNWCATAKCYTCGKIVEITQGAETSSEAEAKALAKLKNEHFPKCKYNRGRNGPKVLAWSAIGACPAPKD